MVKRLLRLFLAGLGTLAVLGWIYAEPAPPLVRRAALSMIMPAIPLWDRLNEYFDQRRAPSRGSRRVDPRPLHEQAAVMWQDMLERFVTLNGALLLISTPPVEIGDMCLWQGVYAGTMALRHQLEGSEQSRRGAERAFEGLKLLSSKGRPLARAVLPLSIVTELTLTWYFRDKRWQWKEDASVDSAAGWVFGCMLVIELVPTRRAQALLALQRFADALIDGGFRLRNSDGKATSYSSMGGALVNSPVGLLCTLAALRTLERNGFGRRYGQAHAALIAEGQNRWAANASAQLLWRNTSTNDNIAHLALVSALLAEDDPERWRVYARGLIRLQRLTEKSANSFWIYLTEWTFQRRAGLARTLKGEPQYESYLAGQARRLELARLSMFEWRYPEQKRKVRTINSARRDIAMAWTKMGSARVAAEPLPVHQRPPADFVWQRSAYVLDGWQALKAPGQDYMPLDFLVAYLLGRVTGALSPTD
jgi:hypothetical protein